MKRTYLLRDRRVDGEIDIRLYTLQELSRALASAGLGLERAYGNWTGEPVALDRPRLIAIAVKGGA